MTCLCWQTFLLLDTASETGGQFFDCPTKCEPILRNYDWPGNVSELKGAIKRSLASDVTNWTESLSTWCRTQMRSHQRPSGTSTIDMT